MPKLKTPANCDSASFDGETYTVGDDGFVDVPEEAVGPLLDHGFTAPTLDELKAAAPKGKK